MKKSLFVVFIVAAFIIYMNFDKFIEIVNDFKYPTLNISIEDFSLKDDGVLTLDIKLKNVTDNPISVGKLEITYIVILDNKHYETTNRNFIVKKTIDKKDDLNVFVMLSDYYNLEYEDEAPSWMRQKKNSFGLKISVKDNSDQTIKRAKRNVDIST
ncbi:hypothetical protein ACFLZ5_09925 [Thermodesulfobacteriota bacterium]